MNYAGRGDNFMRFVVAFLWGLFKPQKHLRALPYLFSVDRRSVCQRICSHRGMILIQALFIASLLVTLGSNTANAADSAPTIQVVPTSIAVITEGETLAQVAVRNPTTSTLSSLSLSAFTNYDLKVVISETQTVPELKPNDEHVWTLKLSKQKEDSVVGPVQLRLDYAQLRPDGAASAQRVVFGSLDVTSRPSLPAEQIADVKVQTSITAINERRPGKLYLVVTNKFNNAIRITSIRPQPTKFIVFQPEQITNMVSLNPRQAHTAAFNIETEPSVQSGKYLLVFEVNLEWGKGSIDQHATLIVTHSVDVGVFGESAILSPLAVPSFLMLPGFLMVALWSLLWKLAGKTFPFELLSTHFWLIAVSLSLVMAFWLYPLITGQFSVVPRNYLDSYSFSDIASVWAWSIGISFLAYLVLMVVPLLYRNFKKSRDDAQIAARTFTQGDSPLQTLDRLSRQGRPLYLEQVNLGTDAQPMRGFLLEGFDPAKQSQWIAPPIRITGLDQVPQPVREAVEAQLSEQGTPSAVQRLVQQNPGLSLVWIPQGSLTGLRQIATAGNPAPTQRNILIETES